MTAAAQVAAKLPLLICQSQVNPGFSFYLRIIVSGTGKTNRPLSSFVHNKHTWNAVAVHKAIFLILFVFFSAARPPLRVISFDLRCLYLLFSIDASVA